MNRVRRVGGIAPVMSLVTIVLVTGLADAWWLHRFRAGFPVDINEAWYMEFGLALKHSLTHDGVVAAWHTWGAEGGFGPLLPLSSVPVFALLGETASSGIATQLVFYALLIVSTYGIGARISGSRAAGVVSAIVVAGTPTVIDFTRTFEFPVTAAAVLAAGTYALLASEALDRRRWAIAWGVLLGLLPLARTMTIAFLPAQLMAAGWLILFRPGPRRPRAVNGLIALVLAAITAGTWLVKTWHAQLKYLTGFGYGSQSGGFSTAGSKLSVGYWTRELVNVVREDLYLPLALLLGAVLLLGLVVLLTRYRRQPASGHGTWARHLSASDTAVVALVVVEGLLAITSSRNEGTGFRVPLLAPLVALGVLALWRLPSRRLRLGLAAALVMVSAFNVVMKTDATQSLSERVSATVPGFGSVPLIDGTGWIQSYVFGSLEARSGGATHPLPEAQRGWVSAYETIAADILRLGRTGRFLPSVDLTTDEPLLNAYDLAFAARLRADHGLAVNVLPGPAGTTSEAAYINTLGQAERIGVNVLVTVTRTGLSYFAPAQTPPAGQALFARAAASGGFACQATVILPDTRRALIWARRPAGALGPSSACAPRVQRTLPAAGAVGASRTVPVVAFFSLPIEPASVAHAIVLTRTGNRRPIPGRVSFLGDQVAVFTADRPLPSHTSFTATVTPAVRSAARAHLAGPDSWSFTTR